MLSPAKEVWRFYWGACTACFQVGKPSGWYWKHIPKHTQFKVRIQEGRRVGTLSRVIELRVIEQELS